MTLKTALRVLLATMMVAAGVLHFARPEKFEPLVPDWLPAPRLLVLVSGAFEIAGGVGLLILKTRRAASWGLMALFAAVFPANVYMATHKIYTDNPLVLWGRLPFQAVLIGWAWWVGKPEDKM